MAIGVAPTARVSPNGIALQDATSSYTWAELDALLDRAVNGLRAADLGSERRVAVVGANCAETVMAHVAGILAGVSTVPINPRLTARELAYIFEDSGAGAVFTGPEAATAVVDAAADAGVKHVVGWRVAAGVDVEAWDVWLRSQPEAESPGSIDVAPTLFYTSGTTGFPKGTFSRPPADLTDVAAFVASLEPLVDDAFGVSRRPTLVVAPLHHIGGLGNPLTALLTGVAVVVMPRFDAEAVLATIERERIGSTVMVPTHFVRLLALADDVRARYEVATLERVGHTGASCPVAVKRSMIEWWGNVLVEAYGATEAGAVCRIESSDWLAHPGSIGRCLDGFRAVVVDDDGAEVAVGETGRLFFAADDGTGITYRNAPDKTAAAHLRPGVFTLGDVGHVDADGYVYVTDRAVDMVISGGVNIYPAEAEHVLLEHPAVADVAVIGVPHPDLGETPMALVEPADGARPPADAELLAWCRDRLAHYKCPTAVALVDTVGRSPMGKLDKRALRAPYWPTGRTISG